MKIKEQTRKLATDRLKHGFELADKAEQVSAHPSLELAYKTE